MKSCYLYLLDIEKLRYGDRKEDQVSRYTPMCSFCGKWQKEVKKLIAGSDVFICNECVDLCNEIIAEDKEKEEKMIKVKIELRFVGAGFPSSQKDELVATIQEVITQGLPALNQGQDKFFGEIKETAKSGTLVIECREKE